MKIIDNFIDKTEKDINKYQGWVDDARAQYELVGQLTLIPEELDEFEEDSYWSGSDLNLQIPWNPKICDHLCLLLEKAGWFKHQDFKTDMVGTKPDYYIYYRHEEIEGVEVIIKMSSDDEHSTCELVQVGTETVERPIWQVKCPDTFSVDDL